MHLATIGIFLFFKLILIAESVNTSNTLFTEVYAYHKQTSDKASYARQVVEKLQTSFKQWFITIIFCEFTYFENRIVKYTETFDDCYSVLLLSSCPVAGSIKVRPKIDKRGLTTYVVSSSELTEEMDEFVISAVVRTGVWKPRSAVIFVVNVPVEIDAYFYHSMKVHFQLFWAKRITNSVLIVWSGEMKVFMYNPYFDEIIDVTKKKDITGLLARQYYNLYGKDLRISVFRKIYLTDETGPVTCDTKIIKTTVKLFNATCVPVRPRDKSTVGDLLENGTATGVTADLIEGYTDMELNSRILKNSYYGYIDTSYPFEQDELCLIVKKSDRQSSFTTTIRLLRTDVLLVLMANLLVLPVIIITIHKVENKIFTLQDGRNHWDITMDLVKCFIRQTVDIRFMGPVFRFMVLVTIMYALIINCAIDAILTSAITYPRYKTDLNTIDDLANSNLTIGVHSRDLDIFLASLTPKYKKALRNRIEIFNDLKIKNFLDNRRFQYAVLMRKSDARYVTRKSSNMFDGKPLFHIMDECPLQCFIVYGLAYGSPYLTRVNYLFHHLSEAGILNHWIETDENTLIKQQANLLDVGGSSSLKPLSMDNLREVFFVLLFGFLASIFGLIAETTFAKIQVFFRNQTSQ